MNHSSFLEKSSQALVKNLYIMRKLKLIRYDKGLIFYTNEDGSVTRATARTDQSHILGAIQA